MRAVILLCVLLALVASGVEARQVEAAGNGNVAVDFYVMSKCPDAAFCEAAWNESITDLLPIIDLRMNYIARQLIPSNITCPHGPTECVGDQQQLCAQLLANPISGAEQWWGFSACQSATRTSIPDNAEECAAKVGLDYKALNDCVSSVGPNLLYYSAERTLQAKQSVSCTLTLNGVQWCQHDSTWKGCAEGNDGDSLIRAVCKRYTGAATPDVCKRSMGKDTPTQTKHSEHIKHL